MKRRYMSYLYEAKKIPRTTLYRKRLSERRQHVLSTETPVASSTSVPGVLLPEMNAEVEQSGPALVNVDLTPEAGSFKCLSAVNDSAVESTSDEHQCPLPEASPVCEPIPTEDQPSSASGNFIEEEEQRPLFEETLCACTSATAGDVYLMTLALGLRHNLAWTVQVDILKMINAMFGRKVVSDTKYHYLQYVKSENVETTTHYYCSACCVPIQANEFIEGSCVCKCDEIVSLDSAPYFISLSLETQIRNLLKDANVAKSLLGHRFNRQKKTSDALEDIYDGLEYQRHFKDNGVLSNPNNFSYSFNTDGVKAGVSCSKNRTMWPIYISLNELPYLERKNNVLLAGLYVGRNHPNMNTFLEPFVDQANKLADEGIMWKNSSGDDVNSKVLPLCAVVDSPARSSMLQMNAFNSLYGCTFCYQKTERTATGPRYCGRAVAQSRTHESTVHDMQCAFEKRTEQNKTKRRHKGVWRPSVLMNLRYFDLVKGFVPDYMHCLLLGAVRQHTEILLDPQRKKKFWNNMDNDIGMEHLISLIDSYLQKITPPHCITRLPRGLADKDLWKASEWRSWLLFYGIVCMKDQLKVKYLVHFSMLSVACNILLQRSISPQDLDNAEELILKYVYLYEEYFGPTAMNYCVHLLLHITDGARNMGPLWTHNAFLYEGQNRFLLQLMSSPMKVALQLTTKYIIYSSLSILCKNLASSERSVEFCTSLTGKFLKFYQRSGQTLLIGSGSPFVPTAEERDFLSVNGLLKGNITSFEKCVVNHIRVSTSSFSFGKRNNDSVVFTVNQKLFSIERFLVCDDDIVVLAREMPLCDRLLLSNEHLQLNHISAVEIPHSSLQVLRPQDIQFICTVMFLPHGNFVSKIPFGCFGD